MYAFDAFRAMLDASWSASARLWAAGEELHRLQSMTLDAASEAIAKAMTDAENARDAQGLLKVQVQLASWAFERTATLSREWLIRLISTTSELTFADPVGRSTGGAAVRAAANSPDGSTIWPTDLLFDAQTAWSQWVQQLATTVNRGPMPS